MPYEPIDFNTLVAQVRDERYRLAAIEVHDDIMLAIASISTLFGKDAVTPDLALEVAARVSERRAKLGNSTS